jgi:hypothetical protein
MRKELNPKLCCKRQGGICACDPDFCSFPTIITSIQPAPKAMAVKNLTGLPLVITFNGIDGDIPSTITLKMAAPVEQDQRYEMLQRLLALAERLQKRVLTWREFEGVVADRLRAAAPAGYEHEQFEQWLLGAAANEIRKATGMPTNTPIAWNPNFLAAARGGWNARAAIQGRTPDGRTVDLPIFGGGSHDGKQLILVALPAPDTTSPVTCCNGNCNQGRDCPLRKPVTAGRAE